MQGRCRGRYASAAIAAYFHPLAVSRSAPHNKRLQSTARNGKQSCQPCLGFAFSRQPHWQFLGHRSFINIIDKTHCCPNVHQDSCRNLLIYYNINDKMPVLDLKLDYPQNSPNFGRGYLTYVYSCRAKSGASGFPHRDEIGKCYPVGE